MINTKVRDTQRKILSSSSAYIAALYVVAIICSGHNMATLPIALQLPRHIK